MDFNLSLDELDDDENFDEFLFQSIQRYNTLQMFNLENLPCHLLQINPTALCVASKREKDEKSELLKLKLPLKLSLPPEEEGRSKENDFKVLSGIYTKNLVYRIDKLEKEGKIITSENNVSGLQIYSFTDSSLGSKNQELKLDVTPWESPDFAIIQETANAICSKCFHEPLIYVDVSVGKKIKEIKHPFHTLNILPKDWPGKIDPCDLNNIKCKPLSTELMAVLNTYSGDVVLHDLRSNDCFVFFPGCSEKLSKEKWTISGFDYRESSLNYFGTLSNRTSICIYDKRKNSIFIQTIGTNAPKENHNCMKMKFSNCGDRFSISGLDSLVQIYKIKENDFDHVFTHNGHCPSYSSPALATDHIWLQAGENEYVVSICDNGTLQCWDYKNYNCNK